MKYTLKVFKNGKRIKYCSTANKRRFAQVLASTLQKIKASSTPLKTYLNISYGKQKDVWGKISEFHNDGWYETAKDLLFAFRAFEQV